MSNSENITAGVPQGSNLGPLLFLLCINDLPNCLDSSVPALFPDNTNLTTSEASASEIQDILEIELNKVHTWLLANKLTLNVKKTQYMLIGSRQGCPKLALIQSYRWDLKASNAFHLPKRLA